jgi:hypothetical protein
MTSLALTAQNFALIAQAIPIVVLVLTSTKRSTLWSQETTFATQLAKEMNTETSTPKASLVKLAQKTARLAPAKQTA